MLQYLLYIGFLLFPVHGDLEVQIAEKNRAIKASPDSIWLYVERGLLYYQHEQADSALLDYDFALNNGLDTSIVYCYMSEALLSKNEYKRGLYHVSEFLKQEPNHKRGIHVRAKLLQALGKLVEAATDFEYIICHSDNNTPQDYIQLANLFLHIDSANFEKPIDVLNRGLERLGELFSLRMKIYELEKMRKNYAAAHTMLDKIMQPLSRKERLLIEKAALFLLESKTIEAAQCLVDAENAITSLPIRFQNIGATIKLKERINQLRQQQ